MAASKATPAAAAETKEADENTISSDWLSADLALDFRTGGSAESAESYTWT